MSLLIGGDIGLKYTWHGLRGKKTFKDTEVAKCLIVALTGIGHDEHQIASEGGNWLRHYADKFKREKGKEVQT